MPAGGECPTDGSVMLRLCLAPAPEGAGRSFESAVMRATASDVPRRKVEGTTAAAWRPARGVPQTGWASGSFPAVLHRPPKLLRSCVILLANHLMRPVAATPCRPGNSQADRCRRRPQHLATTCLRAPRPW